MPSPSPSWPNLSPGERFISLRGNTGVVVSILPIDQFRRDYCVHWDRRDDKTRVVRVNAWLTPAKIRALHPLEALAEESE